MLFLASRGFRCIAHDRRGHGRSRQPWDGKRWTRTPMIWPRLSKRLTCEMPFTLVTPPAAVKSLAMSAATEQGVSEIGVAATTNRLEKNDEHKQERHRSGIHRPAE
jgi:pimeloyl-ACP methyl ester carboxylesterase